MRRRGEEIGLGWSGGWSRHAGRSPEASGLGGARGIAYWRPGHTAGWLRWPGARSVALDGRGFPRERGEGVGKRVGDASGSPSFP